jgi:hypothetical protein
MPGRARWLAVRDARPCAMAGIWGVAVGIWNVRQVEELVSGHQRGDRPTDPVDPKLKSACCATR